ncbi:ABC transporter ATP-binding protein [Subtercola vilae]|uniref:ABC transporter ATP-binding protein n=1 Tax=Subtercola vilae TaxID=2056433 RepID=A0A4T2BDX2_9MICO|nr:ABC transporter ATP-binding protein [Subtercola vilae]TIH27056.1 ABC transporter ATP-binding protein [Subtercola vilae]
MTNVTRTFVRGGKLNRAVDDVSLEIGAGKTLALLGPNGAGKTTLIKMIATLLEPSSGRIVVAGLDIKSNERQVRSNIGLVLGGDRGFYLRASVQENLNYFASLARVSRRRRPAVVAAVLDAVNLADRKRDAVETLSRGLRQRLHIARGLLSNPPLLLLDEPTIGLDPEAALALRDLVRSLKSGGHSILLTTHYLYEAEALADDVAVIIDGRIIARGAVTDIANAGGIGNVTVATLTHLPDTLGNSISQLAGVRNVNSEQVGGQRLVTVSWEPNRDNEPQLREVLATHAPLSVVTRPATLEEGYLALVARRRMTIG